VAYLLNDDLALVFKRLEVWLECQIIVNRLDVLWQDLAAFGNVDCGLVHFEFTTAHSLMGAVTDPAVAETTGVFRTTW